ncbi:MAG: MbnH family di-heme enzyme [Nannocystales bacterium]
MGQPAPMVPSESPMSAARVELGRHLFYDVRLSGNGEQACASCHEQARAFTDGEATPVGSTGDPVPRNSMTLTNVAYRNTLAWSNPALTDLESHALVPLFGEFPVELGLTGVEGQVFERLESDPLYPALFGDAGLPVTTGAVTSALASFQRTLLSYDSPYDRWVAGDVHALSEAAQRGADVFFSEAGECYHCHGGFDFTNDVRTTDLPAGASAFANTGLYNVEGTGRYPEPNVGLVEFTGAAPDMGRFRVPTLRNVAVTAPYMHDGSVETLEEVVRHYVRGGSNHEQGPWAGDGAENPYKDSLIRPLDLDDTDVADVVAFLEALTDEAFLEDPRYADPW